MVIIYFKLSFALLNVFVHCRRNICLGFLSFYYYNSFCSSLCSSGHRGTQIFLLQSVGSQACSTSPKLHQVLRVEKYRCKRQRKGKRGGGREGNGGREQGGKKQNLMETSSLTFSMHQILALHTCGKVIYTCILSIINTQTLICLR